MATDDIDPTDPLSTIRSSGLFDGKFYSDTYWDIAQAGIDLAEHFYLWGFRENRRPNVIFDTAWYRDHHLADQPDLNPLQHYIEVGAKQGLLPGPLFDAQWYRETHKLGDAVDALSHYIQHRIGPFSPVAEFDAVYYLKTYPDIAAAGIDPFQHYINYGYRESRNPSANFDTDFYIKRYLDGKFEQNPLVHYRQNRGAGFLPHASEDDATIPANVKRFTKAGPAFEEARPIAGSVPRRGKVLAYYLTQFHAFPENNKWWGTGFTEWTNIARGLPRYHGHFQPRVPRDNGFYSLADKETMRKHVAQAKAGGIYGFVFYYYWFNTKRLMEKPLEDFLATPDIDMPFCLMWANEDWTRRWDGLEGEVLISQGYSEDDDVKLVADYTRHFKDPRYIRLQGRPLLMIYRPSIIPDTKAAIERWRTLFRQNGGEDPIIVMSQSFDDFDPRKFGLDGAIEFPPHKLTKLTAPINKSLNYLDDTFSGRVYAYEDVMSVSMNEAPSDFPLIKTVVPSWDNDARRQGSGLVIHGSTPTLYEFWLSQLIDAAQRKPFFGEPLVCVNAWNEWCEGAYLEPDLHFGSAYLNATARAAAGVTQFSKRPRLLLIGHDAFPSGAQLLMLNIGRTLRQAFGVEVEFILLQGGKLEAEYRLIAPTTLCPDKDKLVQKLTELKERGFSAAIANTSVAGHAATSAVEVGFRTILLVHELPRILREKGLMPSARSGLMSADKVVFAGAYIQDKLLEALNVPVSNRFAIRPQGTYKTLKRNDGFGKALRDGLGMAPGSRLILGMGYGDLRKGFDLFLQVWRLLQISDCDIHFCWVGSIDPGLRDWLSVEISDAEKTGTFHMAGYRADVEGFFSAADGLVLTSREDPFPTVVLEAMSVDIPVFAFEGTGGIPDFLRQYGIGYVAPYADVTAMATNLADVLNEAPDRGLLDRAREIVASQFDFADYVEDLMHMALPRLMKVSVIVPNFNYAHCLPERLATIFMQTYPVHEVVVLDDASRDESVAVIEATAKEHERDFTLILNEQNSGSVFKQWRKGAEHATGDYLWIAEADDLSDMTFLAQMIGAMESDPSIVMGFSDSKSIDMTGAPVYPDYKGYYATVEPKALTVDEVFEGREFVDRFLAIKNLIMNVSCVVWRRSALLAAMDRCESDLKNFRMAGDWRIYIECLTAPGARIAYVAEPLNVHRRHANSVTHALDSRKHVSEIATMHEKIRAKLHISRATPGQTSYLDEIEQQFSRRPIEA
ncbi:glycoside hydrolase family 99-like domain-containing protein [Lichenihabitans psoromatis]|uniref:glycoside hydrolase family 99-like domain-containing protein n=1 Tax=Lichenihabitans psoromatis TaxID=2528642 RepID=UPI001035CE74|nr:glycoside hydrolase family 99-like domain-containing protein [Lichenihabitans psoromatis]